MSLSWLENMDHTADDFEERWCAECDVDPARFEIKGKQYCRDCAWFVNGGKQPDSDPDGEPPGAGGDVALWPDPQPASENWHTRGRW